MQDFAFVFMELHQVLVNLFLQPPEISLKGSSDLQHVKCSFQFGIICKFAILL